MIARNIYISYYSRDNCFSAGDISGCSTDYKVSDIKQVVDIWKKKFLNQNDLKKDSLGYTSRLLTIYEIVSLGYEFFDNGSIGYYSKTDSIPEWLYSESESFWTMSMHFDSLSKVWYVNEEGILGDIDVDSKNLQVRPVIILTKTALGDTDEDINNKNTEKNDAIENEFDTSNVDVPNTYLRKSLLIIIIGFIFACVSLVIYYIIKRKYSERK